MVDERIVKIVQNWPNGDKTHDINHTMRVLRYCQDLIHNYPECDQQVVEEAALLHDIGRNDELLTGIDHADRGATISQEILENLGRSQEHINAVCYCVFTHRSRGSIKPTTIEAKIVHDADKIDLLGAIGIARLFYAGGIYKQEMILDIDVEDYKASNLDERGRIINSAKHSPNMEYQTKVINITNKMFLPEAISIAETKLEFMRVFFTLLGEEFHNRPEL